MGGRQYGMAVTIEYPVADRMDLIRPLNQGQVSFVQLSQTPAKRILHHCLF